MDNRYCTVEFDGICRRAEEEDLWVFRFVGTVNRDIWFECATDSQEIADIFYQCYEGHAAVASIVQDAVLLAIPGPGEKAIILVNPSSDSFSVVLELHAQGKDRQIVRPEYFSLFAFAIASGLEIRVNAELLSSINNACVYAVYSGSQVHAIISVEYTQRLDVFRRIQDATREMHAAGAVEDFDRAARIKRNIAALRAEFRDASEASSAASS